jgi:hypothetical protein
MRYFRRSGEHAAISPCSVLGGQNPRAKSARQRVRSSAPIRFAAAVAAASRPGASLCQFADTQPKGPKVLTDALPISRFPVPDLANMPEDIRNRILAVQEKSGFIPNVFLVLAHRPDEFRAFFAYHDALMERPGNLTKAEREILRVPGSLDVIFRPWGFPRQRNSITDRFPHPVSTYGPSQSKVGCGARRAVPAANTERQLWVRLAGLRRTAQQRGRCAESRPSIEL